MSLFDRDYLASNNGLRGMLEFLILAFPMLTLNLPDVGISSAIVFLALAVVYIHRNTWRVESDLKIAFMLLLAWGIFFTAVSEHPSRSLKGAYDMLRGAIMFPLAMVLATQLKNWQRGAALSLAAMLLMLLNFAYLRGGDGGTHFFGYHENPNNVAVNLFMLLMLSMVVYHWRGFTASRGYQAAAIICGLGLVAGLYLMLLTNSRQAWLALAVPPFIFWWLFGKSSLKHKVQVSSLVAILCVMIVLEFNHKGASLSRREEIWVGLFNLTMQNHPWLGYGLNVVKDVLSEHAIITQTAHNTFLEVFTSSGFVGLIWFLSVLVVMGVAYARFEFERTTLFYIGFWGLMGYFIMGMFDLKLSSYRFFGAYAFFLGLIYSQRKLSSSPKLEALVADA